MVKITVRSIIFFLMILVVFFGVFFPLLPEELKMTLNKDFSDYNNLAEIKSSDRIIIFSPHPDDETLANSAIIRNAVKKNATILIVMMTNGDAYPPEYLNAFLKSKNNTNYKGNIGELRHNEVLNAIKVLGLNESNIIFLGYPDSGLKELLLNNWDYNHLFKKSTGSNTFDHSPYVFSYEKNAPYCGANVAKNLDQIMDSFKPNIIFIPDDGDDHQDHWATSAFVRYVAVENGYNSDMYNFLVHKGISWPDPFKYSPDDELLPPDEIFELDAKWMKASLNKADEILKEDAVKSHESQIYGTKDLLESFIRTNEFFSDYPMITLQKESGNYSLKQGMPKSSFKDLKMDSNTLKLQAPEDLTAAGLIKDDHNLNIILQSKHYSNNYIYVFHLFLYDGRQFNRIDIEATNGSAKFISKASNNLNNSQTITVQNDNNLMGLKIPLTFLKDTKNILMTADVQSSPNSGTMDFIAMRVFKID